MEKYKDIATYGTVGLDFGVSVIVGLLGGWWLDSKFGWTPWATLIGLVLGIVTGFHLLFKTAQRLQHQTQKENANNRAHQQPVSKVKVSGKDSKNNFEQHDR